jgi:hypothetical protein
MHTDNTKHDVFAMYGATAYCAQMFEDELQNILLLAHILKKSSLTRIGLERIGLKIKKAHIGRLLGEIKKHYSIPVELEKSFNEFREKRNYLTHHFFFKNAFKMLDNEGRKTMIIELKNLCLEFKKADEMAEVLARQIRKDLGWSENKFKEVVKKRYEIALAKKCDDDNS